MAEKKSVMDELPVFHKKITVSGRVQGVGFRHTARIVAEQLNICGLVRNMPDGSVFIEAEGTLPQLESFINWCYEGPPHAHVRHVAVIDGMVYGYTDFQITR
ncbi:MAG TPA: acylphosphatase [Bacteroidales bacterium]|nr:acylphosphatase [Bacteroidales bacterium]